jgi:TolB protein
VPGPDTEPAWSPDGRHIAYTAWRDGNQEILVVSLDNPSNMLEQMAENLTNTPEVNENYAAWNSDGSVIAYSASARSVEGVYIKPIAQPNAEPIQIGLGRMPAWSPNDASLVYMLDYGQQTQLLADTAGSFGGTADATLLSNRASDPDWTGTPLPPNLIASGGLQAGVSALYDENPQIKPDGLYGMAPMNNVVAPQAFLSDTVDDSFEALRQRVIQTAGYDFLGTLEEVWWPGSRPTEPGEPQQNWHYAGRAFAIDRNLVYAGSPAPIEVAREDIEVDTYWRVYVRVVEEVQDGRLGEPLRVVPWDLTARTSGDVEDYERGGKLMTTVPSGYYVDLTQLAEDYGWERVPSDTTWRYNFSAIQYWEFRKTDGLSWADAMLQLYSATDLQSFIDQAPNIQAPVPLPTESPTPGVQATNTPIPPDQLQ